MIKSTDQDKKLMYIFIAVSVMVHAIALVYKTAQTIQFDLSENQKNEKIIPIKLLSMTNNKNFNQIVQTQKTNNKVSKNNKVFLGEKNNKVDRETKAKTIGKFKEAGIGVRQGIKKAAQKSKKQSKRKKIKNLKLSDLGFNSQQKIVAKKKIKRAVSSSKGLKNGKKGTVGLGKSNDYIEDIPLGDFTKLNTQEYEFYGFYNRIREKLEQFWGRNIQDQADKIQKSGRSIASDSNHITSLEIALNSKGEIVHVQLNSTSGVRELDDAAIKTFNQAGPFPNPPTKMIKGGKAKIRWSFVVNT